MKVLTDLIRELDKKELSQVDRRIASRPKRSRSQLNKLLEGCLSAEGLNGLANLPAYRLTRLKSELRNDVLCTMLSSEIGVNCDTDTDTVRVQLEKQLLIAKVLRNRGLRAASDEILRDIRNEVVKRELHFMLIEIDHLLGNHGINGPANPDEETLVDRVDVCRRTLYAEQCLSQMQRHYVNPIKYQKYTIDYSGVESLGLSAAATESERLALLYYLLAMNKCMHSQQKQEALDFARAIARLLQKNAASLTCEDKIIGFIESASAFTQYGKYTHAQACLKSALEYCKTDGKRELYALDRLFLTNLHYGSLGDARRVLTKAQKNKFLKRNKCLEAKWKFYEAVLLFRENEFKKATIVAREKISFSADYEEWLLGYHYLELLLFIEKDEIDLADSKQKALRLMLYRKRKRFDSPGFFRLSKILNILRDLIDSNFDYNKVYDKQLTQLMLLQEGKKMSRWEAYGYELVRFDQWFIEKVNLPPVKHIWH